MERLHESVEALRRDHSDLVAEREKAREDRERERAQERAEREKERAQERAEREKERAGETPKVTRLYQSGGLAGLKRMNTGDEKGEASRPTQDYRPEPEPRSLLLSGAPSRRGVLQDPEGQCHDQGRTKVNDEEQGKGEKGSLPQSGGNRAPVP
ncbi:hypothetical protein BKA70DRAFT_1214895 [Coprinopsis sp. MPI-PUGE-AT-0042]|nr:hypothetical protein BKA70DRAFT_1214895 [Coprinopsis sp. MPI-PUGE-AT-0042]